MLRIERGRSRTKAAKISIASVAREAGVSPALIHNHYPAIADAIRQAQGRSSRQQRDAKHEQLKAERDKTRELRQTWPDCVSTLIALLRSTRCCWPRTPS